jgi:predicted RNase H-like nuclease
MDFIYTGIDGCRGGWLAVSLDFDRLDHWEVCCFATGDWDVLDELVSRSNLTLVDIPLGLGDGDSERESDRLIRRALGRRGSSIFPVPVREAVYAESYSQACEINFKVQGKKLSKQLWNLGDKIRSIDGYLKSHPEYRLVLRESSPEYAFQLLSGAPLDLSKSTSAGVEERLSICSRYENRSDPIYQYCIQSYPRKACAPHDILDALILAITALLTKTRGVMKIPETCRTDRYGIPIQAIFCDGER